VIPPDLGYGTSGSPLEVQTERGTSTSLAARRLRGRDGRDRPVVRPRLVDTGGNNNGLVCAKPQADSVRDNECKHGGEVACQLEVLGLPHYLFKAD
jgi:hypothetical protein